MSATHQSISVVIGFRDWGLARLRCAVVSHRENARLKGIDLEVVVSDFGSAEPDAVVNALSGTGAVVARTERTGPWNRSAALNAGIAVAKGEWIITTDADIIFSPELLPGFLEQASKVPAALYLVQCRDLPEGFDETVVTAWLDGGAWERNIERAESVATIRPRWGMGGFAAFSRECFSALNGYEERMRIWGGEDNDFAARVRRFGQPVRWLSAPHNAIYHVWHAPSQTKALDSAEGAEAVAENRRILREDHSFIRNLPLSKSVLKDSPLVSIIIPTFQRAALLRQSLASCVRQTFGDFEVLVVENGDSHVAAEVVNEIGDERVKYLRSPRAGAAAARNVGLDRARGKYIVIHDDDDIMTSSRVEAHLRAMTEGVHGTYSGWVDFDEKTFQPVGFHSGEAFSFAAVLCSGKVLTHGALMLERSVYEKHRYQEGLVAGIDYGFILLLARCGLSLAHTGEFGILRRLHATNMTAVNATDQKAAASEMVRIIREEISADTYAQMQVAGRAAAEMACSNRESALHELTSVAVEDFFREFDVLKEAAKCSDDLSIVSGHWSIMEPQLSRLASLPNGWTRLHGIPVSDAALLYSRLRLAANQLRGPQGEYVNRS